MKYFRGLGTKMKSEAHSDMGFKKVLTNSKNEPAFSFLVFRLRNLIRPSVSVNFSLQTIINASYFMRKFSLAQS